jgi:hypothetical protein
MTAATDYLNSDECAELIDETDELINQIDALFIARGEASRDRDQIGRELNSLVQRFTDTPTEELANSINLKMGTYAIAHDKYRSLCDAFDALAGR